MGTTSNAVTRLEVHAAQKQVDTLKAMFADAASTSIDLAYKLEDFFGYELHKSLGYSTRIEACQALFDVSYSHVNRLCRIAYYAAELGFTQKQIESIYAKTGHLSSLAYYLSELDRKVSVHQAVADLRTYHVSRGRTQFNILMSKTQARKAEKLLRRLGMEVDANGRRSGVAEAHAALVDIAAKHIK